MRMSDDLHERLNAQAREEGRSLNDLVVAVLEQESRRYQREKVLRGMIEFSRQMGKKPGVLPGDVTGDIRRMREERAERA